MPSAASRGIPVTVARDCVASEVISLFFISLICALGSVLPRGGVGVANAVICSDFGEHTGKPVALTVRIISVYRSLDERPARCIRASILLCPTSGASSGCEAAVAAM